MSNSVQLRHFLIVLSGFAVICLLCTFAYRIAVKHEAIRNTSLPSGVCDIPFNLPMGHFNVSEETPINCSTGESVKLPPLVMRYNEATREDELCKVPGNEHLQCVYSTVHYQGDNTNTYGSQWYPLDEDTVLTRAHLIAQEHDGETRYVLGRCTDRASDKQHFEDVFIFFAQFGCFCRG